VSAKQRPKGQELAVTCVTDNGNINIAHIHDGYIRNAGKPVLFAVHFQRSSVANAKALAGSVTTMVTEDDK